MILGRFAEILGDMLFPCRCCSCGELVLGRDFFLCEKCRRSMERVEGDCPCCGSPMEGDRCLFCEGRFFYPAKNVSPFVYSGVTKDAMKTLKFKGRKMLARALGNLLYGEIEDEVKNCDIITFVPMERSKIRARGYNQSREICRELSRISGKPLVNTLREVPGRAKQKEMAFNDRFFNVMGRFSLEPNVDLEGKTILLLDDVFTTGATVNECARILLQGGAKSIFSSTICRSKIKTLDK